jgi:methylated-DNA-protein-cysteine methyltransferase-like protein
MNRSNEAFYQAVYDVVCLIPVGKVMTYGAIAEYIDCPRNSRLVGKALKDIPDEMNIPAWRVVNAQGRTAPGWDKQRELLEYEGVRFKPSGLVDLKRHLWRPEY